MENKQVSKQSSFKLIQSKSSNNETGTKNSNLFQPGNLSSLPSKQLQGSGYIK